MHRCTRSPAHIVSRTSLALLAVLTCAPPSLEARTPAPLRKRARPTAATRQREQPQPRPHGMRVEVDPERIVIDDGDTLVLRWAGDDAETVRILGVDAPETRHPEHDIPHPQPFGAEARAFAQGAFATASRVELLRAATLDGYGRSLGYLFLNGRNYSALLLRARLAAENVSHYGDNGLPAEAAEVLAAARAAGPPPFEPPHLFRNRMRELSRWMRGRGLSGEQ
jgi:micrococcal nuclease